MVEFLSISVSIFNVIEKFSFTLNIFELLPFVVISIIGESDINLFTSLLLLVLGFIVLANTFSIGELSITPLITKADTFVAVFFI